MSLPDACARSMAAPRSEAISSFIGDLSVNGARWEARALGKHAPRCSNRGRYFATAQGARLDRRRRSDRWNWDSAAKLRSSPVAARVSDVRPRSA